MAVLVLKAASFLEALAGPGFIFSTSDGDLAEGLGTMLSRFPWDPHLILPSAKYN